MTLTGSCKNVGEACHLLSATVWFHCGNPNARMSVSSLGLVRVLREESFHLLSGE